MRIVEFGTNENPVFLYSRKTREEVKSGAIYVGIDIKVDPLKYIHQNGNIHLVTGDLGKIPLTDKVADQIWALNVFGGDFKNRPEKMPDGALVYNLSINRHFQEMTRILVPGGKIYIGEWLPRIHDPSWMKEADFLDFGLSKKVYEGETLQEFVGQHGFTFGMTFKDTPPFFIELTKMTDIKPQTDF